MLFIYPLIVVVASIVGYLAFKTWFVVPLTTLFVFTLFMFTVYNGTFLLWVIIYTGISLVVTMFMTIFNYAYRKR